MPITVPAGVDISVGENNTVTVKGPKGTLSRQIPAAMRFEKGDTGAWTVSRPDDAKQNRSLHGLTRTLLNNMVTGVTAGFTRDLEINGVGYRAQLQGKQLVMNIGYSHQVIMDAPEGITIAVPAPNKISVSGCDKQAVGQFAANIREKRPPEPYKGKGIRYAGEFVRHKEGKAGAKKK
jgi:large subunit ribosomal protein L6